MPASDRSPLGTAAALRFLRKCFQNPESGLIVSIAIVLLAIYFLDPSRAFFSEYSRQTLLHQISLYGVLAVGAAAVIISGGIDLSVGAIVAMASIVSAKLLTEWLRTGGAGVAPPSDFLVYSVIGLTLLMGLAIGLFHAFLVNQVMLPPFIATLATMAGLRSLASILCDNKQINLPFETYRALGRYPWYAFITFCAVAISLSMMMGWTVLGRHLYALGGNETAARLSGLKTKRLKAIAYGLSGMLAALTGILFTGRSGQADYRMGVTYELNAITAAVVGGCSLVGGVGSIRGAVLGLVLLQILINGTGIVVKKVDFTLFGKHVELNVNPTQIEGLVLGTVIILAVAVNQRFRSRS